jgi:hypothetical protein
LIPKDLAVWKGEEEAERLLLERLLGEKRSKGWIYGRFRFAEGFQHWWFATTTSAAGAAVRMEASIIIITIAGVSSTSGSSSNSSSDIMAPS